MPATRAAFGFSPTARNLKPRLERLSIHQTKTVGDDGEDEAQVQVVTGRPSSVGKIAVSASSAGDFGLFEPGAWSRPGVRSR